MYNVCVSGKWDDGVENFWNNKKKRSVGNLMVMYQVYSKALKTYEKESFPSFNAPLHG